VGGVASIDDVDHCGRGCVPRVHPIVTRRSLDVASSVVSRFDDARNPKIQQNQEPAAKFSVALRRFPTLLMSGSLIRQRNAGMLVDVAQEPNMPRSDQLRDCGYQSIVSAVDFSPQSSAALQMAAELAGQSGGHLTALYVEDASVSMGAAAAGYDKTLLRKSNLTQLRAAHGSHRPLDGFRRRPGALTLLLVTRRLPS
jgi:Universal stress protein family